MCKDEYSYLQVMTRPDSSHHYHFYDHEDQDEIDSQQYHDDDDYDDQGVVDSNATAFGHSITAIPHSSSNIFNIMNQNRRITSLFKTDESIIPIDLNIYLNDGVYFCNLCPFNNKSRSNFRSHMMIHTGEKPYACMRCPYRGSQKNHLDNHMKTHTGEKPFICNFCTYKTALKGNLKRHLYLKHNS